MKFADKYELSDAVTSGRLETFKGRDTSSGEPVLVHIFDAPVKKPDQPTVLWVLESFRTVAPEPPGLVIATGKYGGTSYAYLVTQVPDDAALRKWKQAYESSTAETREIPVERNPTERSGAVEPPVAATSSPTAHGEASLPASSSQPSHPPTGFFPMRPPGENTSKPAYDGAMSPFQSAGAPGNELDGISFGPRNDIPSQEPGDLTKQFYVGAKASPGPLAGDAPLSPAVQRIGGVESAPDTAPGTDRSSSPASSPAENAPLDLGGFTAFFRPTAKAETRQPTEIPQRIDAAPKVDDGKAGDFTNFFQGPFDGERPSEIPDVFRSDLSNAPRGRIPGEFTQMFGAAKDGPSAAVSSASPLDDTPLSTDAGTFMRSFGEASQVSSTTGPPLPA